MPPLAGGSPSRCVRREAIGTGGGLNPAVPPPPAPITSARVGRGVASVIETLKGHPLFAHITLTRSERSAIAALVSEMLDGAELT